MREGNECVFIEDSFLWASSLGREPTFGIESVWGGREVAGVTMEAIEMDESGGFLWYEASSYWSVTNAKDYDKVTYYDPAMRPPLPLGAARWLPLGTGGSSLRLSLLAIQRKISIELLSEDTKIYITALR